MLEPTVRAPRDGAEQVQVGDDRLWRRDVGAQPRRGGLVGESEDEERVGQHEFACGLRAGDVVLIEAANLARRQVMRSNGRGEADTVARVGARQRHQILHRRMRDDVTVAHVLLNRIGEGAQKAETPRHPAHTAIEASRDHVERQSVLLVQRAQQPRLLEDVLGCVGLEEMAKDQRVARDHVPHDRRDRVPVQPVQAADAFMAVHDEIARVTRHDDDRHLLPDVGERRQQPALAGGLPHTEPVVPSIQLVKFQLHRPSGQGRRIVKTRRCVTGSSARDRPQTMQCCEDTRRPRPGATPASLPNRMGRGEP
jgi:hypothetical protein